jgi:hypothetical protein
MLSYSVFGVINTPRVPSAKLLYVCMYRTVYGRVRAELSSGYLAPTACSQKGSTRPQVSWAMRSTSGEAVARGLAKERVLFALEGALSTGREDLIFMAVVV